MNKGIIYCTTIQEEYEGAHMEHMIAEKLLETALKKEYGINLYNEPRAEGEHGKPFLSYRPSLHYNISHSGKYVVCILADQEVGIDVQIHCRANYERMLRRMVPREQYLEILSDINLAIISDLRVSIDAFFPRFGTMISALLSDPILISIVTVPFNFEPTIE